MSTGVSTSTDKIIVDKSRSHVANLQRLLTLPAGVIAHVEAGQDAGPHEQLSAQASDLGGEAG